MASPQPDLVYKYRAFSNLSLEMLVEDTLFFADPSTFNDPLDAKPKLEADLTAPALEAVLETLMVKRVEAELSAAAKIIHYQGPKTLNHISRRSQLAFVNRLADIRYNATDPDNEMSDPLSYSLERHIETEVLRRYEKGIVSLAERPNCPLMWSHYGDQHRGFCVGYATGDVTSLHKVKYGGSPVLKASLVQAMLNGGDRAQTQVDAAVLLRKAKDWAYEREWRLIGQRGSHYSPLEMTEVVFGLRCPTAVQFTIVRALAGRSQVVAFFEILPRPGTFELIKSPLDVEDLCRGWPRRAADYDFDDVFDEVADEVPSPA